jgi:hypothetical protein
MALAPSGLFRFPAQLLKRKPLNGTLNSRNVFF